MSQVRVAGTANLGAGLLATGTAVSTAKAGAGQEFRISLGENGVPIATTSSGPAAATPARTVQNVAENPQALLANSTLVPGSALENRFVAQPQSEAGSQPVMAEVSATPVAASSAVPATPAKAEPNAETAQAVAGENTASQAPAVTNSAPVAAIHESSIPALQALKPVLVTDPTTVVIKHLALTNAVATPLVQVAQKSVPIADVATLTERAAQEPQSQVVTPQEAGKTTPAQQTAAVAPQPVAAAPVAADIAAPVAYPAPQASVKLAEEEAPQIAPVAEKKIVKASVTTSAAETQSAIPPVSTATPIVTSPPPTATLDASAPVPVQAMEIGIAATAPAANYALRMTGTAIAPGTSAPLAGMQTRVSSTELPSTATAQVAPPDVAEAVTKLSQQAAGTSAPTVDSPAPPVELNAKPAAPVAARKKEPAAKEVATTSSTATGDTAAPEKVAAAAPAVPALPSAEHAQPTASPAAATPAVLGGVAPVAHVAAASPASAETVGTNIVASPTPSLMAESTPSAAVSVQEVKTLTATPQVLEVGVSSGTHGWLRLRAEMSSSGEVTASVVATSASAAQTLHRELPALNDYLSREQVSVASVNVSAALVSSPDAGTSLAADAGGQRRGSDQPTQQQVPVSSAGDVSSGPAVELGASSDMTMTPSLYRQGGGGGWVNVRV